MGSGISSPQQNLSSLTGNTLPCLHRSSVASYFITPTPTPTLSSYYIGVIVGKGGFGTIRKILRKQDEQLFALKSFELKTVGLQEAESIVNELLGFSRIPSNPFIIQVHAAFRDCSTLSYVMDLLVGGDLRLLFRLGEIFPENKIAYLIACIGSALHHIHLHHIIHRDVKPENIMFTANGTPKLIDLGISYLLPANSFSVCICQLRSGTSQYIAPETFVNGSHCHGYESDYWSLGIVMYEMLYLRRPFESRPPIQLVNYSEKIYKTTWQSLLTLAAATANASAANTAGRGFLPSKSVSTTSSAGSVIGLLNTFSVDEEETSFPLDLIVPLPQLSALDKPPSDHCLSLLSALLEVRIHKRLGVGENYSLFAQHPFFISFGVDVDNAISYPSPILPNMDQVELHLWDQFYSLNQEEVLNNPPSHPKGSSHEECCCCSLSHEVEKYLRKIQQVHPLFYDSTG